MKLTICESLAFIRIHQLCEHDYELLLLLSLLMGLAVMVWFASSIAHRRLAESTHASLSLPLPPGTYGWPLIGETMRLKGCHVAGKPDEFVQQRMVTHNKDIFKTSLLGEPMAFLCGPAGNKLLFSNENKITVTWWPRSVQNIFPHSIVTASGPDPKQSRKLVTSFFRPEALRSYVGTMDSVARAHIDAEWVGRSHVKAFNLVKNYAFTLACRLFASIDDEDCMARLGRELHVLVMGVLQVPLRLPGTRYYRALKAAEAIRGELGPLMKGRRMCLREKMELPVQDLLSYLLVMKDENGRLMEEEEIVDNILLLLFAGHDTTTSAITLVMKNLAEMPHIYIEVLKEQMEIAMCKGDGESLDWDDLQKMKYSWNVVNETLRMCPPVSGAFREAIADFTFAGFSIPKGWKLSWSSFSTHKNPDYFPKPEKFDPSRFEGDGPGPYTFVPFGGGPRMCPGKEFARLEILVFLHNVVKRFKWEAIIPDEQINFDAMPCPAQGLPIRLQPHHF